MQFIMTMNYDKNVAVLTYCRSHVSEILSILTYNGPDELSDMPSWLTLSEEND